MKINLKSKIRLYYETQMSFGQDFRDCYINIFRVIYPTEINNIYKKTKNTNFIKYKNNIFIFCQKILDIDEMLGLLTFEKDFYKKYPKHIVKQLIKEAVPFYEHCLYYDTKGII